MPCEHVLLGCSKCTKERDTLRIAIESWKKEEAAWIEERKRLRDAALEEAAVIAETLPNGSSEGYEAEIAALIRARK